MMIREILDGLTKEQVSELTYAFENSLTHIIDLPNDQYIGVNVLGSLFRYIEVVGAWSYGKKLKKGL